MKQKVKGLSGTWLSLTFLAVLYLIGGTIASAFADTLSNFSELNRGILAGALAGLVVVWACLEITDYIDYPSLGEVVEFVLLNILGWLFTLPFALGYSWVAFVSTSFGSGMVNFAAAMTGSTITLIAGLSYHLIKWSLKAVLSLASPSLIQGDKP